MKRSVIILLSCFLITIAVNHYVPALTAGGIEDANLPISDTVKRVIDGDTIVLTNGETVRLIGVDTPELHHPSRPIEYFAIEAKDFVKKMVESKDIKLVLGEQKRGKYGRLLAYVYLPDGTFLNEEIIKQGYGFAYTKYPFEFAEDFVKLQAQARRARLGLWAEDDLKELKWLNSKQRKPFKIYDTAGHKWAIEYAGMAKTFLTNQGLLEELEYIREAAYGLTPKDLRAECSKRGWQIIKSERKEKDHE